jgi:membrane-associated phospholipid phosphatase
MTGTTLSPSPASGQIPAVRATRGVRPGEPGLAGVPWVGIMLLALGGALAALAAAPFALPLSQAATQWLGEGGSGAAIDRLGDAGVAGLGLLAALGVALARRSRGVGEQARWVSGLVAAAAAVVAFVVASGLKGWVHEVRPCTEVGLSGCPPLNDYSWPSNHTAVAVALAVAVVVASSRLWLRLPAGLLLVVVLASRVASGAHWVHDVASGVALGALVSFVVLSVAHGLVVAAGRRRAAALDR